MADFHPELTHNLEPTIAEPKTPPKDRSHWLYITVIIAVIAGVLVGYFAPEVGLAVKPLGTIFVSLIKMMIAPVIFCTIVLGIGSVKAAASVGKTGGIALAYFMVMSIAALAIGLLVGNLVEPGEGLKVVAGSANKFLPKGEAHHEGGWGFVQSIIPESLFTPLTGGPVLQTLLVALLCGFAIQRLGKQGEGLLQAIGAIQKMVFRVLIMILWLAPLGAFGAMAGLIAATGLAAITQLFILMFAFYLTCFLFVVVLLGSILKLFTGVNVFSLLKYLAREFLLIVATSSSESALPNLMVKMEHLGISRSTVGIVVPTGYSFNLDGTAIYLTMSSIFIADAMGKPMNLMEQILLLIFMIIASKGAAGVTGAGLATLAAGLQQHRPDFLDGVGIIVGIDRFMSEARALTNFAGNAIATLLVAKWTNTVDLARVKEVLSGNIPFEYSSLGEEASGEEVKLTRIHSVVNPADNLSPSPYPILPDSEEKNN